MARDNGARGDGASGFGDRNGSANFSSGGGDLYARQIPQAVEAERAVLGSILLLPEVFDEVALVVRPGDFYDDANRRLYEQLHAMHDGGHRIDLMLLVERLKKADVYESCGGAAYLAEIGREVPTAAHAEFYAKIVADKAVLRSLIHASVDIQQLAYDPTTETREILGKAEERLFAIL
jgi:replicative DNA helicase